MNHILRKYEKEHTMLGIMKEYKSQLDQRLFTLIDQWLEKHYN
ncbi:hypothetical protein ACFO3D_16800 [Virgibacillus kekensis]|uniref:N-terminal Ras-GEF domain-containing protein n=1 Tax=Virgibacillus kekensis TaxID=202261 RepID=A0ABV9DLT9_9BACI